MLEELRQKPKSVKERWAFWSAFILTLMIASVWLLSLSFQFRSAQNVVANAETENINSSGAFSRSFSDVKANISSAWSAFTGRNVQNKTETDQDADQPVVPPEPVMETETSPATSTETTKMEPERPAARTVLIATTTGQTVASSTP